MTITRVERVVYGVTDLDECLRFFDDFGLERASGTRFTTQTGQMVELVPAGRPDIKEIVWGVASAEALEGLAAGLGCEISDGEVHTADETGFGVGLTVSAPRSWHGDDYPGVNRTGAQTRWNRPVRHPGRVRPIRLCHVALNIPQTGREQAVAFYTERLGFVPTDRVRDVGRDRAWRAALHVLGDTGAVQRGPAQVPRGGLRRVTSP